MSVLILMAVVFAAVWLLMIRPQRRRQSELQAMIENLKPGDEIITAGGIIGEVRAKDEDEVLLEIAPDTTVRLSRRAVAAVVPPEVEDEEEDEGDEEPVAELEPAEGEPAETEPQETNRR